MKSALLLLLLPGIVTSFGIPEMKKAVAGAAMALSIGGAVLPAQPAMAESRVIGEIAGSGLIFKDTLTVESFDDPKVCVFYQLKYFFQRFEWLFQVEVTRL